MLISLAARGRGGPRDSLGMIVHRDLETDIYKIAGKVGVLNGVLSRNQFDLCPQNPFPEKDASPDKPVFAVSGHSADSVRRARVYEMSLQWSQKVSNKEPQML